MNTIETFGQRIEYLLKAQNISQKQLAIDTEIGQSRLSDIINDKADPTMPQLAKLAKALNVTQAALLGEEPTAINNSFNGQKISNVHNVAQGSSLKIETLDIQAERAAYKEALEAWQRAEAAKNESIAILKEHNLALREENGVLKNQLFSTIQKT